MTGSQLGNSNFVKFKKSNVKFSGNFPKKMTLIFSNIPPAKYVNMRYETIAPLLFCIRAGKNMFFPGKELFFPG